MMRAATPPRDDREVVFGRLLPLVTGWCERLGGGVIDTQAAASDALVVLVRRADRLEEGDIDAWAYGVTRQVVRSHRRRAWLRRWVPGLEIERRAPRGATAEAREATRLVHAVLDRLPEAQREVIVLMDLEERSAGEVATLLGIPEGTVRSRLRLARAAFRTHAAALGLGLLHAVEEDDHG